MSDATLQASTILGTDGYVPPPDGMVDLAVYLQRIFGIKDNALYWSEAYAPFNFTDTGNGVVTKEDENLVACMEWGDQLFLASAERWYRLLGNDPDTWSIRRTFTDVGIINRHTLKRTKYGLVGLWNDGIYVSDGSVSRNITEKKLGRRFFTDLSDLSVCYAEFDGQRYFFYYASTGSTLDNCIVIDFAYYPEYRIYSNDFIATAHEVYKPDNTTYLGYGGYEYSESGTETIATSLQIISLPASHLDMVRPGIMLYGYPPLRGMAEGHPVRPVISLRSRVTFLKAVEAGTSVSYGRRWFAPARTRIATVPIGYADGFRRLLTNRSSALIRGKRYAVVGTVCMDHVMVDVGPEDEVETGDTVTLIGTDGAETITAWDLAATVGTIPYEVTCLVTPRVPRLYREEGPS